MDGLVILSIFDFDGNYELSAEVSPNFQYEGLRLRSVASEELWDNDIWLLTYLMPAAKCACEMREGYELAAKELTEEWNIPEEDFCAVNELFDLAKAYGMVVEESKGYDFSMN